MLMTRALKNKSILLLWIGQLSSNIGDEIFKVAFVWLAVTQIGANTGYLSSIQLFVFLIFGILGGKWSDRWSPSQTMINIDLMRMLITLIPVLFFLMGKATFIPLVISSILIAALGAFFEPAIQTSLPLLCNDLPTLKGANGLLATTLRLARVLGPAIIGILSIYVATIHFFTINALSFFISAISIYLIQKNFPVHSTSHLEQDEHILKNFFDSWKLLKKNHELYDVYMAKTITGGAWALTYALGIALLIHEIFPGDVKAFGLVMGAYGVGNVSSALVVGNMQRKNPARMVYIGLACLGVGFIGMAISHSYAFIVFFSAFAAIGGPLNDLPSTDLIQTTIEMKDLPKIFRLKMTLDNLAALIFLLFAPILFHLLTVRTVIFGCGALTLGMSLFYLFKHSIQNQQHPQS